MRTHVRTVFVLALVVGLLALFLHNVDLWRVATEILRARPQWLALALLTMLLNLAIRAWRWQFLLEPLGRPTFGSAFRATAVGFAATSMLPQVVVQLAAGGMRRCLPMRGACDRFECVFRKLSCRSSYSHELVVPHDLHIFHHARRAKVDRE